MTAWMGPVSAADDALVARAAEVAAFVSALRGLNADQGRLLMVCGDSGLGKTTLLKRFADMALESGARVLTATCFQIEREIAYATVVNLFQPLVSSDGQHDLLHGAAEFATPLFEADLAVPDAPASAPLFGLYWLAANASSEGPLVLIVDDAHWADEASAQFLAYLVRRISGLPILVVCGTRHVPIDLASWERDTLYLKALDRPACDRLVRSLVSPCTDELCTAMHEGTGGNPLQVREAVRDVVDAELGMTDFAGLLQVAKRAVGRTSLYRLMRLDAATRQVAITLAVLGEGATPRHVVALSRLDSEAVVRAIDTLDGDGLLAQGLALTFAHPSIREAILADLSGAEAGLWHHRAAQVLADEGVAPEVICSQLLLAPGMGQRWAVDALLQAAANARRRGAVEAAARYLKRALEEPAEAADRGAILADLGAAEAMLGDSAAIEHLTEALQRAVDPAQDAGLAGALARALVAAGRPHDAALTLEAAMDRVGAGASPLNWSLLADYLITCTLQPALRATAIERAEQLLAGCHDEELPASLHAAIAMRLAQEAQERSAALVHADKAWGGGRLLVAEGPMGSTARLLVWALFLMEEHLFTEEVLTATAQRASTVGDSESFAAASFLRGFCRLRRGVLHEALADVEQALAASSGDCPATAAGLISSLILIERGDVAAAERAFAAYDAREERWLPLGAMRPYAEGRLQLARGMVDAAHTLFCDAGRWLTDRLGADHTVVPWREWATRTALMMGDRPGALALIEPLEAIAGRGDLVALLGVSQGLRGLALQGEEGIACLRRSVDLLARTDAQLAHARSMVDLGSALYRLGAGAEAERVLSDAVATSQRLGALTLARLASQELEAAGGTLRSRGADRGALTPSERRIAQMAAIRLSNAEIAQSLFVTPKTVEFHLGNVYRKLAISGRRELVKHLAEQASVPSVFGNKPREQP